MGDPERPAPRPRSVPADDEPADAAQAAELSRAARDAVRQPADPRIDRQLAWLGLTADEPPSADDGDPAATGSRPEELDALGAEVERLTNERDTARGQVATRTSELESARAELADARSRLETERLGLEGSLARTRLLTAVVVAEAIVIVVLAALVVLR